MKYDPQKHHRRSIRLKGYDYSQPGAYFITICTRQREMLFGQIREGIMVPNHLGEIVQRAWFDLPAHYPHVTLGAFCLMPNHVHGIIILTDEPRRGGSSPETDGIPSPTDLNQGSDHATDETRPYAPGDGVIPSDPIRPYAPTHETVMRHGLPEIVRAFKSFSARRINAIRRTRGVPVWQRNYYEQIIRNEADLGRITVYIQNNPLLWDQDQLHSDVPNHSTNQDNPHG